MDYNKVAKEVISHVGGPKNIKKAFHCATRLRLMLKDPSLADEKALESVDGGKGTFLVQEQFLRTHLGSGRQSLNKIFLLIVRALAASLIQRYIAVER